MPIPASFAVFDEESGKPRQVKRETRITRRGTKGVFFTFTIENTGHDEKHGAKKTENAHANVEDGGPLSCHTEWTVISASIIIQTLEMQIET